MRITIFGASGGIGRLVTKKALEHGHQVTAYVRRADAFPGTTAGLSVVVGNLDDKAQIERAVTGADAVISALGPSMAAPRKSTVTPVADGHRLIVAAMEEQGVKRLVTLATPSVKAKEDPKRLIILMPAVMAKALFPPAYRDIVGVGPVLESSKLDWTVVRIVNPNAKHKSDYYGAWIGEGKVKMSVSRENAAACQLECAEKGLYIRKMPVVFNL
jgi:putative NADH-flavin reductase